MTEALLEHTKKEHSAWSGSISAEESARRMAEVATKLQESQPSMSFKTLLVLVIGAVQGKSHRHVKL